MTSSAVLTVTDSSFQAEVLEADRPVVVDFTAAWCGPCRILSPLLAEIAAERPDVRFAEIDVDSQQGTAAAYSVLSMPTIMVFRGGEEVLRLVGARPKRHLLADLAPAIGEPVPA